MQNHFPGRCRQCRAPVPSRAGKLISHRGRLVLYCAEHDGYSEAQRFVRGDAARDVPPATHIIRFQDGSIARRFGSQWAATRE